MTRSSPRTTTDQRTRGRKLQAIRARHFRINPLCSGPDSQCEKHGIVRTWDELDHAIPLAKGGQDSDDNRQGLCSDCHEAKTARDMGYRERVAIGVDGWPVDGVL